MTDKLLSFPPPRSIKLTWKYHVHSSLGFWRFRQWHNQNLFKGGSKKMYLTTIFLLFSWVYTYIIFLNKHNLPGLRPIKKKKKNYIIYVLESECIDFTMNNDVLFFFNFFFIFVSVIMVWGSKTASIFFKSILFDGKVNLVGTFGRKIIKFSIVFKSAGKKQNKN